jgi:hypothetical protein
MVVRILLVLAALGVLQGCDQASSPPEHSTPPPKPKTSISATATQKEIHHHDEVPALLGDEQMAKLDDAGRKQLLACQRDLVHEVWGDKQAAENEIANLSKQTRKKSTTVQQEMWSAGYRCPEEIPGMEHLEVE